MSATSHISLRLTMEPKVWTLYIDFMRFVPNLTHFIDPKKLKNQFGFFNDPLLFGSEYLTQVKEEHPPRKFIHQLGALRPLSPIRWKYSFWRNLFGGTSLVNYVKHYLGEYFGYLPYFIKSSWKINIEPNSQTDTRITQILSRAKITLTARLFPMGATAMHIMVFFTSEEAKVEHFIEIQKMLLKYRLYRVRKGRSAGSKLLTLEEIFDEVQNLIYHSMFNPPPRGILEAKPGEIHRVMYIHLLQAGATDDDIQMAAASLISLNPVETRQKRVALLKNRLWDEKFMHPDDLIIFHPKATLIYTPKLNPHRKGFCLWNNYINVVEMATMQNFVLRKANSLLEHALSPHPRFTEFADYASFLQGLGSLHQNLRGQHKLLYNKMDKELELSKTTEKFDHFLQSYVAYQSYEVINQQIQSIETTLIKMKKVADTINFNQIGIVLIDTLLDEASDLMRSLSVNTKTLREIDDRERRGAKLPNDTQDETNSKSAILNTISRYRRELLSYYEHIIGELLDTEEKAKIDVATARTKLGKAKQMKDFSYTYGSAPVFVKETGDYVKTLVEAADEGLKNFP